MMHVKGVYTVCFRAVWDSHTLSPKETPCVSPANRQLNVWGLPCQANLKPQKKGPTLNGLLFQFHGRGRFRVMQLLPASST